MWNKQLIACAQAYPTGVLTLVDAEGYPFSVRCAVEFDAAREVMILSGGEALLQGRAGKACLLFHRHNPDLSGQHELMIKGELALEDGRLVFRPSDFLTGTGRQDTDRMPVAGSPVDIFQFMLLGRRKAREYLAKRGTPWPPRPWDKMLRSLDEPDVLSDHAVEPTNPAVPGNPPGSTLPPR
jgi:hypothetical protein